MRRTLALGAVLALPVFAWVLLFGSLADLQTRDTRTAFALGIAAVVPVFVIAGELLAWSRR